MDKGNIDDDLVNIGAWVSICEHSRYRADCVHTFERILKTMSRLYDEVSKIRKDLWILRFRSETRDLINVIIRKLDEQDK